MGIKFSNLATTTLSSSITASATSIDVTDGSVFPALSAGDFFYATLDTPPSPTEIVKVTALSGNTLTVVRAQDGTSATSHGSGDTIALRLVAAVLESLRDNAGSTYTAGSGLSLTGTTFSNTAPDQTVSLTGSGGTTVSGTYPNFTISSTSGSGTGGGSGTGSTSNTLTIVGRSITNQVSSVFNRIGTSLLTAANSLLPVALSRPGLSVVGRSTNYTITQMLNRAGQLLSSAYSLTSILKRSGSSALDMLNIFSSITQILNRAGSSVVDASSLTSVTARTGSVSIEKADLFSVDARSGGLTLGASDHAFVVVGRAQNYYIGN